MKKIINKGLAIMLAVLMAMSGCVTAVAASVDTDFSLEIKNVNRHYAGMTYTVTATLGNLTESELTEDEFTWSIDDASAADGGSVNSLSTMNTIPGDGTYTVSQTASLKLPDSTGTTTVTARYGTYTKTMAVTRLEPIRHITLSAPQTDGVIDSEGNLTGATYYYSGNGTLYLNAATGTKIDDPTGWSTPATVEYQTNATDDDNLAVSVIGNSDQYNIINNTATGNLNLQFTTIDAPENTDLVLRSVPSGRTESVIKLVECTPMEYTYLYVNGSSMIYNGKADKDTKLCKASTTIYTGTSYTISTKDTSPASSNDVMEYTLYNSDKSRVLDCYSIDSKGNCILNVPDSGDYILECSAKAKGGYLQRDYTITVYINAAKPNYISGIDLKQVDGNGDFLAEDFEGTTLYKGSSQSENNKYNLKKHVKIANQTNYSAEDAVLYESSDESVATVDENGVVTAVGSGTATITVYSRMGVDEHDGKTIYDTCDIRVYQLVDSIDISSPSSTLPQGHSIQLAAQASPATHDETLSWGLSATTPDSNGNYPLTITRSGFVTANDDYNFEGKSEVSVDVVATARLEGTDIGEISAKYTIRVIPSVNTSFLQITAAQDNYGFLVEGADGSFSDANTLYQDDAASDATSITYNGDAFSIGGVGYDSRNTSTANRATDVYKWTVAYSSNGVQYGEEMTLDDATKGTDTNPNQYFKSCQYNLSTDRYTITPQINGSYRFTCYAVNRGADIDAAKAVSTFTVKVVYKANSIAFATARMIMPTETSAAVKINLDSSDAYRYDPVTYTSLNSTVATVEKAEDYNTGYNVIITAGTMPTSGYVQAIMARTRSGKEAYFSARVTENIDNAVIEFVDPSEYVYDGTDKRPRINVYVGDSNGDSRLLTEGTDYSLEYQDNRRAGLATIIIHGRGALEGSTTIVHFTIHKKVLGDGESISDYLSMADPAAYYDITEANPAPVPTITIRDTERGNARLNAGEDYIVTAIDNTTAGTATATVTGCGSYEGEFTFRYNLRDMIINARAAAIDDVVFTGKAIEPEITLTYSQEVQDENGDIQLVDMPMQRDVHYTVAYTANVNVGEATVTITGREPYFRDRKVLHFNIKKARINTNYTCQVKAETYRRSESVPAPLPSLAVFDADRSISLAQTDNQQAAGNCFYVTAVNNISAGTATATVHGIGNYSGTFDVTYEVADTITNAVAADIPDMVYTGSAIEPEPELTYTQKIINEYSAYHDYQYTLVKGVDYTVRYINQVSVGTATMVITGTGTHFYGEKRVDYSIVPIEIQSDKPVADVVFRTDASSSAKRSYGLLEKDGHSYAYKNDTMTILGIGVDAQGKNTNNTYSWKLVLEDGNEVALEQPTAMTQLVVQGANYLEYSYNKNNSIYTIVPRINGDYTFVCTATDHKGNRATSAKTITVVDSGRISFANVTDRTIPVGGKVTATLRFDCLDGYRYNSCTFSSNNYNVATVTKDADYATSYGITITAGSKTGTARITAESRNGATTYIDVTVKNDIAAAVVSGVKSSYAYTGEDIRPEPTLIFEGMTLTKGVDYDLRYDNCRESGTATITITGRGNDFAGASTVSYTIGRKSLGSLTGLSATVRDAYYLINDSVSAPEPNLDVRYTNDNGYIVTLRKDIDYTVKCSGNTKAGVATATITGKGNYSGSTTVSYNVCDNINKVKVAAIAAQTYSATVKEPSITVTYKGTTLKKGTDYDVRYQNNINVGTATVIIDGKTPKFYGTTTATFNINPKKVASLRTTSRTASSITLAWKQDPTVSGYQIYDTVAKKVVKKIEGNAVTSFKKTGLTAGKEYRYKIRAYTIINGVMYYGAYSSIHYTYTTPAIPALKLTTTSKAVKASWAKISGVGGYEIQYSTKSSFASAKTTKLGSGATSKKFTGLKKGTTYYVRVRSYKSIKVNGKATKVYSAWKTAKIKCK